MIKECSKLEGTLKILVKRKSKEEGERKYIVGITERDKTEDRGRGIIVRHLTHRE